MIWDPAFARVMTMMTLSVSAHVLVGFSMMMTGSERAAPLEPVVVSICDSAFAACAGEPFPEVRNWNSLAITLWRGECFGSCPIYRVTIHGDGRVVFLGGKYTGRPGLHESRIPPSAVHALFEKFRAASFFALNDDYSADITDHPSYTVVLAYDGRRKMVTDYVGRLAGMPLVVTELEGAIDEAANTPQWVGDLGAAQ